jgi:hypothetical protein
MHNKKYSNTKWWRVKFRFFMRIETRKLLTKKRYTILLSIAHNKLKHLQNYNQFVLNYCFSGKTTNLINEIYFQIFLTLTDVFKYT